MEIKNTGWFFISLILLIIGTFIVIFDYPQIQFFDKVESESNYSLDENEKSIHQKLKIEFFIGIVFVKVGIILFLFSIFWNVRRR